MSSKQIRRCGVGDSHGRLRPREVAEHERQLRALRAIVERELQAKAAVRAKGATKAGASAAAAAAGNKRAPEQQQQAGGAGDKKIRRIIID